MAIIVVMQLFSGREHFGNIFSSRLMCPVGLITEKGSDRFRFDLALCSHWSCRFLFSPKAKPREPQGSKIWFNSFLNSSIISLKCTVMSNIVYTQHTAHWGIPCTVVLLQYSFKRILDAIALFCILELTWIYPRGQSNLRLDFFVLESSCYHIS